MSKKTIVLGASPNPDRYSHRAVSSLVKNGHEVVPLGIRSGQISSVEILTARPEVSNVDTITLYINPAIQKQWYDYIIGQHPKRLIFNPGTENTELEELAQQHGIATIEACTLVLLSTQQY